MSAVISPCGQYRYRLERDGGEIGQTAVIMVNPSTADATQDDQTITKVRGFGRRNGWGKLVIGNLFAYRATDIRELAHVADPIGPDNDDHLRQIAMYADRVIIAWGALAKLPSELRGRHKHVLSLLADLDVPVLRIGTLTSCAQPKHPLMLAYDTPILPWE